MKKLVYSAALFAATLIGFPACSDGGPDTIQPTDPAAQIGKDDIFDPTPMPPYPHINGPESIELGQLYSFKANSLYFGDTFTFTVEDTYFHNPSSYAISISTSGDRIYVVFNEYGHYKISAKSKADGSVCSYEVAKYYKEVGPLRFASNAPSLRDGFEGGGGKIFSRRLERTGANFPERVVINTMEYFTEYWYPFNGTPYMKQGANIGTVTGVAAKGTNRINLPNGRVRTHPDYDPVSLNNCALLVPFCSQEYTIPEERCGRL